MHNRGVIASALLCFSLFGAPAQGTREMERALAIYNQLARHKSPKERARAAEALGEATSEKHDRITVKLTLDLLRREIARGGRGGKAEQKVSGLVLEACLETLRRVTGAKAIATLAMTAASRKEGVRLRTYATWSLAELE